MLKDECGMLRNTFSFSIPHSSFSIRFPVSLRRVVDPRLPVKLENVGILAGLRLRLARFRGIFDALGWA
jgi:hypothetical protein